MGPQIRLHLDSPRLKHNAMAFPLRLQLADPAPDWPRWATWGAILAAWTLPGLAALSYYYLNQTVSAQPMSWGYALVSTLPNWYLWAAMTPAILWLARHYRIERSNWKTMLLAIHVPAMILCMSIHSLGNLLLFYATGMPGHDDLSTGLYRVHFVTRVHANLLTYWTILGFYYAFDYYKKLRLREHQSAVLEIRLAEANLRALKMQLHPHFLFNTLNSIAALVRKDENRTAINMLVRLGDFLRLALENKGVQEITLKQEVEFLERYLDIEKIRFQERLTVHIDVQPAAWEAYVPNMILQPLVENAIHHGISPHADAGYIEICARIREGMLYLYVRDDGPGLNPKGQSRTSGVGLVNIRERLQNLYGEESHLSLRNADEGGLLASITIPFATIPVMATKNVI